MQENQAGSATEPVDVIVVGAGIAGLAAAGELARAGRTVTVLEKSRGLGGRMATRRLAGAVCDHGAQFFTVRKPLFENIVTAASAAGKVRTWCEGFFRAGSLDASPGKAGDGHARWCGAQGMTDLPKFLAAELPADRCTIRLGVRLASLGIDGGGVRACLDDGSQLSARAALLTAPVPQSLDLLAAGGLLVQDGSGQHAVAPAGTIDRKTLSALVQVDYDPCFALMLVLRRPSLVPAPGGIQFASGPIAWLGDNSHKGISSLPALTVHASGAFSREHFDKAAEEVANVMLEAVRPWIDVGAGTLAEAIVEQSLHRWKFATPTTILPDPLVALCREPAILCCGDAFAGPRVEGAALSGLAAAAWLAPSLAETG